MKIGMYISFASELVKAKIRNVTNFGGSIFGPYIKPRRGAILAHVRRKLTSLDKLIKIEWDITSIFLAQKT